MRCFWVLVVLLHGGVGLFSQTETYSFDLIHRDKAVGELSATKTVSGDQIIYSSQTTTTISLLMDFVIVFDNTVKIRNGKMEYADMSVTVNKKSYGKTVTKLRGREYVMDKDGDEKVIKEFPIRYCASLLVFFEPKNENTSFSEKEGNFHALKHVGNNVYEKTDHKGRINKYYYKNGLLSKAEIDAGLIHFKLLKS